MSTLVESDDRPVCRPGRANELRFPQIEAAFSLPRVHKRNDSRRHASSTNMSYCSHNSDTSDNNKERTKICNKPHRGNKTSDAHHAIPQPSNLLKFPGIDLPRSSSFVCLTGEFYQERHTSSRVTMSDGQKKFQLPSCLMRYEEDQNGNLNGRRESQPHGDNPVSGTVSFMPDVESKSSVKFPSIFGHHREYDLKLPSSVHTSNNASSMNPDTNSFSIKIKQPFCNLPDREATFMRMKSKYKSNPENTSTQKSSSHCSPLLLPISTTQDYKYRQRRQKKRKTKGPDS